MSSDDAADIEDAIEDTAEMGIIMVHDDPIRAQVTISESKSGLLSVQMYGEPTEQLMTMFTVMMASMQKLKCN